MSRCDTPTVPCPRPDPVPVLARIAVQIERDRRTFRDGEAALSAVDAARLRRMVLGQGCAGCGSAD